jgi:hypothetical protein
VQLSEVQAIGAPDVRVSIARAAEATGVDFDYLLAQAKLESKLDPHARAGTSSAAGLYQFIGSTWLETLDRHGARHGLGWADAANGGGKHGSKISDPAMRSQIMALRYDPDAASLMAAELANDNRADLRESLGREPDFAELYLAHFLGSGGAQRFLTTLQQQPDSPAATMFPKQAAANRSVFYDGAGAPRSVTQVMDFFRQRLNQAMAEERGSMPPALPGMYLAAGAQQSDPSTLGPLAREFHESATGYPAPGRISMVETLRETFAGAGNAPAMLPSNVKTAYSKLKAYGL